MTKAEWRMQFQRWEGGKRGKRNSFSIFPATSDLSFLFHFFLQSHRRPAVSGRIEKVKKDSTDWLYHYSSGDSVFYTISFAEWSSVSKTSGR